MAEKVRNFGQKTVSRASSRGFRSLLLMRKTSCTIRDGQCHECWQLAMPLIQVRNHSRFPASESQDPISFTDINSKCRSVDTLQNILSRTGSCLLRLIDAGKPQANNRPASQMPRIVYPPLDLGSTIWSCLKIS